MGMQLSRGSWAATNGPIEFETPNREILLGRSTALSQVMHQRLTGAPGREEVDDSVPKPLQRQDERAHNLQGSRVPVFVHNGEDSVSARREPGDEDRREEEDGALCVGPGGAICLVDFAVMSALGWTSWGVVATGEVSALRGRWQDRFEPLSEVRLG